MKAHLCFMEILTSLYFVLHNIDLPFSSIHLIRMPVFYIQVVSKRIEENNAIDWHSLCHSSEDCSQVYMNPLKNNLMFSHSSNKKSTQQCYQGEHVTLYFSKYTFTLNEDIYIVNTIVLCSVRTGTVLLCYSQTPELCLTHRRLLTWMNEFSLLVY